MNRMLFRATVSSWLALASALGVPSAHAARARTSPPARPWMDKTIVAAPKVVGPYVLDGVAEYEFGALKGAQIEYSQDGHPDIKIVLQVYSIGRIAPETALESGVEHFGTNLGMMETLFDHRDLDIGAATDVALPLPAVSGDAASANAPAVATGLDTRGREMGPSRVLHGKRLPFRYRMPIASLGEHVPIRSVGYVFHDRINYIRGRVSARPEAIDDTSLSAFGDEAMRLLVPSLRIVNVGACADSEPFDDPTTDDSCVSQLDDDAWLADDPVEATVVVVFDPEHWGSE